MKTLKRMLCVLLTLCAALSPALAEEGSRGVLYRVTSESATVYLLGSIHIGSAEMYPFGTEIAEAISRADQFAFECDTESADATPTLRARMALAEGETLADHIGEALFGRVSAAYQALGLNASGLSLLRPWIVTNTLSVYATAAEMGATDYAEATRWGVEKQVLASARAGDKPMLYLETLTEQIDVLDGFSDALQRYLLTSVCDILESPDKARGMDASVARWPDWWRAGDIDAFADAYLNAYPDPLAEAESREYHESLIVARNRRMSDKLAELLAGDQTTFATLGLLHLVLPEDSVVALLRERGFEVEQLSRP